MKRLFSNDGLLAILVAVAALAVQTVLQLEPAATIVLLVCVFMGTIIIVLIQEFGAKKSLRSLGWLYSQDGQYAKDILGIEASLPDDCKITLITPNIHSDSRDSRVKRVVNGNLRRGILHSYVTIDTPETRVNINSIRKNLPIGTEDLVSFDFLEDDFFLLAFTHSILIFDDGENPRGFFELPLSDENSRLRRPWLVEVESSVVESWIDYLSHLYATKKISRVPQDLPLRLSDGYTRN